MPAQLEVRINNAPGNGSLRPVADATPVNGSMLRTRAKVETRAQVIPNGFKTERVTAKDTIEDFKTAKLSFLGNATAVHDTDGNIASLVTSYSGTDVTQYLVTDEGFQEFRTIRTQPDGTKKEIVDELMLESITGAWVVVRNTYGPEHMMYMYMKNDVDGLPKLPKDVQKLYLKQQVNEIERLQRLNEKGEEDGELREVEMGLNRSHSVNDGGLRSAYRLHIHSWRNGRSLTTEQAIDERNAQKGFDGGISSYLGRQIAAEIAPVMVEYWDAAEIIEDEMGLTLSLKGYTPQHLLDNGKGVNAIDGLIAPIDQATDRQLDIVHRTAFNSERKTAISYVDDAIDAQEFVDSSFKVLFEPRVREDNAPEGKYITDPAYRDADNIRKPAGSAMGIVFTPEIPGVRPAEARISLSAIATKGSVGTMEVTQVAELEVNLAKFLRKLWNKKLQIYMPN